VGILKVNQVRHGKFRSSIILRKEKVNGLTFFLFIYKTVCLMFISLLVFFEIVLFVHGGPGGGTGPDDR